MSAVNEPARNLDIDEWVQGEPTNINHEYGKVILIEIFQVNCPGCFLYGLPEIIEIYQTFQNQDLIIWGLATAFEDFHLNNLENLKNLVHQGEVIGEVRVHLASQNRLVNDKLGYRVPFPIAWDRVIKNSKEKFKEASKQMIRRDFPKFSELAPQHQKIITQQVDNYIRRRPFEAKTFNAYGLRGTPSTLLIDKKGMLRQKYFGTGHDLRHFINLLLEE